MARKQKGQMFILAAIVVCLFLLSISSLANEIIISQTVEEEDDIYFVFKNIKNECFNAVEVGLARYTQTGADLDTTLDTWRDNSIQYCSQKGYLANITYFDESASDSTTEGWAIGRANFSITIQSEDVYIHDEFLVYYEVYLALRSTATDIYFTVLERTTPQGEFTVLSNISDVTLNDGKVTWRNLGNGTYIIEDETSGTVKVDTKNLIRVEASI